MCVGKADVAESNAVKAVVDTVDCVGTTSIFSLFFATFLSMKDILVKYESASIYLLFRSHR